MGAAEGRRRERARPERDGAGGARVRGRSDDCGRGVELLARWVEHRDEAAFSSLLSLYWARAYRVALALLGNAEDAEDCAQRSFVAVARKAAGLRCAEAFDGWFAAIVGNTAREIVRTRARRRRREERAGREREFGHEPPPGHDLQRAEIRAAVALLPDRFREPIELHYFEGLSHRAVAEALGCPVGTASSRLRLGLQRLRAILSARGWCPSLVALAGALGAMRQRSAGACAASCPPRVLATRCPPPPPVRVLLERLERSGRDRALRWATAAVLLLGLVGTVAYRALLPPVATPRQAAAAISGRALVSAAPSRAASAVRLPAGRDTIGSSVAQTPHAVSARRAEGAEGATVFVEVVAADTLAPVSGAWVHVVPLGPDGPVQPHGRRPGWGVAPAGRADRRGRVRLALPGDPAGSREVLGVLLAVVADGYGPFVQQLPLDALARRCTIALERAAGATLRGLVCDRADGSAVAGLELSVVFRPVRSCGHRFAEGEGAGQRLPVVELSWPVRTDAAGAFSVSGLPPGSVLVVPQPATGWLLPPGADPVRWPRAVSPAPQQRIEVVRAAAIELTVHDPTGAAVPGAWVLLRGPLAGQGGALRCTDTGGRVRYEGLVAGRYRLQVARAAEGESQAGLRARARWSPDAAQLVSIEAGAHRRVAFRVAAPAALGALRLRTRIPDGTPAPRRRLVLARLGAGCPGFPVQRTVWTDAHGIARVAGLSPGRYRCVEPDGGAEVVFDLGTMERSVEIAVPDWGPVCGTVRDEDGAVVADALVHVSWQRPGGAPVSRWLRTDVRGRFRADPAPPGSVRVSVLRAGVWVQRRAAWTGEPLRVLLPPPAPHSPLVVHGTLSPAAAVALEGRSASGTLTGGGVTQAASAAIEDGRFTLRFPDRPLGTAVHLSLAIDDLEVSCRRMVPAGLEELWLSSRDLETGHVAGAVRRRQAAGGLSRPAAVR